MNHSPIKILLVEDSAGGARLIIEAFADVKSPGIQVKHVQSLSRITEADNQLKYIHKIEVQTLHIQSIVEDLFTLMRLETESAELLLAPLDLNTIVEAACTQQSAVVNSRPIQLHLDPNLLQILGVYYRTKICGQTSAHQCRELHTRRR